MSDLLADLGKRLPPERLVTDELRRLAYGTDASFYRLTPEIVAIVENEAEVQHVLACCQHHRRPATFRAAGTSLSGQAVTDGVLVLLGDGWDHCEIRENGELVRLGPGMVGAEANRRLAPLGRKIGPDPASINAAKIGGIAANNASGMCCGTAQNTYRTLAGLRVVLADGSILDTEDPESVALFRRSHAALLDKLAGLARSVRETPELEARIRRKFKIKNTTGYSLNALVDFADPIDILSHLMVGSEGTLGFISRITYTTVPEHAHKASALVFFPDIETACHAVRALKAQPVAAVELLDRPAIHSVEKKPGMPADLADLPESATALLIESRAESAAVLTQQLAGIEACLADFATLRPVVFTADPQETAKLWNIRKGVFPSVGAIRKAGTTVIIEDVAVPVEHLAAATRDLQSLFATHGYHEAVIFGHALEGNLHFVFTQDFGDQKEVARYAGFMDELCHVLVERYEASLKAEHGTGRNVAPFVELEWGAEATALMREIKALFDPARLLNPGVILNDDPLAHLKHLKPMPAADELVDRCIECGFCEPQCPSHGLTLSPRQRIVGWREIARRERAGEPVNFATDYAYMGLDTCAACGLCSTACPVYIETGALMKKLRGEQAQPLTRTIASWTAGNFSTATSLARGALRLGSVASRLIGDAAVQRMSGGAWRSKAIAASRQPARNARGSAGDPVVYFPTCASRMFAPGGDAGTGESLIDVIGRVMGRAGYRAILPEGYQSLCCGQAYESKGLSDLADSKSAELERTLLAVSDGGRIPIVMDASACSFRMKRFLGERLTVLDFAEFAHDALLPRLRLDRKTTPVALHVNCSLRRMGLEAPLRKIASACAEKVVHPASVTCCGFGGDRGFVVPELNRHALRRLPGELNGCHDGYSTNATCEIGLTAETGVTYRSLACLLDECSRTMEDSTC